MKILIIPDDNIESVGYPGLVQDLKGYIEIEISKKDNMARSDIGMGG